MRTPGDVMRTLSGEALGYIATLGFLLAYLLNMADVGPQLQTALNLVGAVVAATYLYRKHAIPSVISNIAWGVITIGGAVFG